MINCSKEDFFNTSEFRYIVFPVIYSFIFALGLPANLAALWFLIRRNSNKELSEVKIYMINLTAADLLFIIFLPLWIKYYIQEGNWTSSSFLCSLNGSLFYINTYSSVYFLALISFNRYRAVVHPLRAAQLRQKMRGFIISTGIWIVTIAWSLPVLIYHKEHLNRSNNSNKFRCFENYQDMNSVFKLKVTHSLVLICFVIAFGVVIVTCILILQVLSATQQALGSAQRNLKNRAFRMVIAVMMIFIICFVPHHLLQVPWLLLVLDVWKTEDCKFRKNINDIHQVTSCLMSINCILDPIMYCFLTTNFKQYITQFMQTCRALCSLRRTSGN
ncbi:platelet-activating factor receptor [Callorhinchus milii]|uniref:platelet-activating factor receptor n=1 Tax=Callorhinchus milii TaxID=7868 RepID=UPI0004571BEE|nr:platelet-activating factor receptor [Callorhinchus milii]|eukprot:gi/632954002/ref/XP_007892729.1/ PREDICTED: platelet-activating factor receptor-like [Callorhinchus milii]